MQTKMQRSSKKTVNTELRKLYIWLMVTIFFMIIITADIDECATGEPCGDVATCKNTIGSYQCICFTKGFEFHDYEKRKGCFGKTLVDWTGNRMICKDSTQNESLDRTKC